MDKDGGNKIQIIVRDHFTDVLSKLIKGNRLEDL